MVDRLEIGAADPRVRTFVKPERIVWRRGDAKHLMGADTLLGGSGTCVMRHDGGEAPALLLDFGRELHGGIRLTNSITPQHAPTPVRIHFGESAAEAMGTPDQDHAIHTQDILVPWYGYAEFGNTGFRYVRIDLIEPGTELHLKELVAVFIYRDLEYKGAFTCSDDLLNTIWKTGAYTVHLNMQDRLWDGVKRDRLVWIGDMHPETMTINAVFGDVDVVPKSLDYVRGETPLPGWMNGISSYSLWWVMIQWDWYRNHGNLDYVKEQRDYLEGLIRQLAAQVGEDGRERMGKTRFLDWPSSEDEEAIHNGLQGLLTMGLTRGAELCDLIGLTDAAARARTAADLLKKYALPATRSKQAAALTALAGLRPAAEVNREVLAVDPLKGVSTFYGYYVLQARAMAGDHAGALEVIRKYWGAMLELGATTFWEDFNLDWVPGSVGINDLVPEGAKSIHTDYGNYCYKGLRHSLCHGWASGPTAWMSEHVLGFRPLAPGCAKLLVKPNLCGLDWAEGRFPTPKGVVSVRHEAAADGKVNSKIDAPEGVEIVREA